MKREPRRSPEPNLGMMKRPPTHPGEILLEDVLKPLGHGAQSEAARRMGMSLNRLNEILLQKRSVTAESAVLIGAVTGTSPEMWMRLQSDHDLWHALQDVDTSGIKPLRPRAAKGMPRVAVKG